jgi:sugar phosphate isomerase/epimerase
LRILAELRFNKFDVAIHEGGHQLKPSEVAADVGLAANRLRFGPGLTPAAFSVEIQAQSEEEYHRQFKAVCRLARLSTVPLLCVPAAAAGTPMEAEVQRLTKLVHLTDAEGLLLTVPSRVGTLTENPNTAVELCEKVPNLGLTLDPSHYIAGPHNGGNYDQVFPFVRHVYLRDTGRGPNQFQVRVGQGEVEYGRIIAQLSRQHFDRILTVDIHEVPDAPVAMEQEVRKLKYLLESLV